MRTIEEAWKIIINWFKKTKPELLAYLNEGAKETEITDLERHIGKRLPGDLRTSLLLHNGTSRIFLYDGYDVSRLLPISEIKKEYDYRYKFAGELKREMAENEEDQHFSENDIPVLWFSTGDHSLIDSKTGNLYFQSHDGGSGKKFENYGVFLNTVADGVVNGRFIIGEHDYMTGLTTSDLWNLIIKKAKHEHPQICFGEKIESSMRLMIRKAVKSKFGNEFYVSLNLDLPEMVNTIFYRTNGQKDEIAWFNYGGEGFVFSNLERSIEVLIQSHRNNAMLLPLFYNSEKTISINLKTNELMAGTKDIKQDLEGLLLNYLNDIT